MYFSAQRSIHNRLLELGFKVVAVRIVDSEYRNWLGVRLHSDEALRDYVRNRWNSLRNEIGDSQANRVMKEQRRRK